MGQRFGCCHKQKSVSSVVKQDKYIDDKRMLKVGIEVMKKDFCVQIGYNRRAVKTYGERQRQQDFVLSRANEASRPETTRPKTGSKATAVVEDMNDNKIVS